MNIDEKRNKEKRIVKEMISLYCKHKHKNNTLCEDCNKLLHYA